MELDRETPVGIVGAGRMGGSLARAMHQAGRCLRIVARRDRAAARRLAGELPGVAATDDPQEVVDAAEIVVLATADSEIERLAATLTFRPGQAVVHCSGATPLSALDAARARGAETGGFHPLQTFPTDRGADRFRGITVGLEATDAALRAWLEALAETLGARPLLLSASMRSAYHAAAFMVSGLLATYVESAAALWARFGVERRDALAALSPLMERTLRDVHERGADTSLTGPIVRGDVGVVTSHLAAIEDRRPESHRRAYAALGLLHLTTVRESSRTSSERQPHAQIEDVLWQALSDVATQPGRRDDPR